MWYEILPSFGIIVIAMAAPHGISFLANKALVGNFFRRSLQTDADILQYKRDIRLAGNPYKVKGLENIPDA